MDCMHWKTGLPDKADRAFTLTGKAVRIHAIESDVARSRKVKVHARIIDLENLFGHDVLIVPYSRQRNSVDRR